MSAIKDQLIGIAEMIEAEVGCDFDEAQELVLDELDRGTDWMDVFDVVVDRHCAQLGLGIDDEVEGALG